LGAKWEQSDELLSQCPTIPTSVLWQWCFEPNAVVVAPKDVIPAVERITLKARTQHDPIQASG